MRHLLLTSILLCSTTAYGASLDWSNVTIDTNNMATFSLHYTDLPDFNYNLNGVIPNTFDIIIKDAGQMATIIRGEYMPLGYGLPIFNPTDVLFTPGQWQGAVRYALDGNNTLNFSASLELMRVTSASAFSYRLDAFQNGAWAAQYAGCAAGVECYSTSQVIVASTVPVSTPEPSFLPMLIGLAGVAFAWYRA